jgi:hypothetical protein
MDITSPTLLKLKGLLFALLGLLSATLLLLPILSWRSAALLAITVWAFCRAYYFCFYVMHHYVDPSFRYAGLLNLFQFLLRGPATQKNQPTGPPQPPSPAG